MTVVTSAPSLPCPVNTIVIRVDEVSYLLSEDCYTVASCSGTGEDELQHTVFRPVTVVDLQDNQVIRSGWLERQIKYFLEADDVFSTGFLTRVILRVSDIKLLPIVREGAKAVLTKWGSSIQFVQSETRIPLGPYAMLSSTEPRMYQVSRLYPDPQLAFMCGLVPSVDKQCFHSTDFGLIPVPSRLYSDRPSDAMPLSGIRIAVKDIFDIAGTTTSAGNKAFDGFYGVSQSTAPAIQQLVSKGAIIIGKTKLVQFASGENPMDWIDYHCPFNPRGDGYLTAGGSSTGSAAALATYAWLDISIGTDTFGSMIVPASWQGLYGIRPTHGVLDHTGVLPHSRLFDTPGHFARDIDKFARIYQAWYGDKCSHMQLKPLANVLYLSDRFEMFPRKKINLMNRFIDDLVKSTRSQRMEIDVAAWWEESSTCGDTALNDFLATTLAHIQLYDCFHNNKKFGEDYKQRYGGEPYVDPMIRFKWYLRELGKQLTRADYDKACKEKDIFMSFVREELVKDDSILVLPMGRPEASYRDEYLGPPEKVGRNLQGFGFGNNAFAVLAGLPALNIPVAQLSRLSKATHRIINEPISVMLVGPPGSDGWLMGIVKETLLSTGRPLSVQTGADTFAKK